MLNRTSRNRAHNYDIVTGPTANDDTLVVINAYLDSIYGEIGSENALHTLLRDIEAEKLPGQICFLCNAFDPGNGDSEFWAFLQYPPNPRELNPGDALTIYYDPQHPKMATSGDIPVYYRVLPAPMIIFGLILLFIGYSLRRKILRGF